MWEVSSFSEAPMGSTRFPCRTSPPASPFPPGR